MDSKYSVSLDKIIEAHGFEVAYAPEDMKNRAVISPDVSRPGLIFTGFDQYFDNHRIQFLGAQEMSYIGSFPSEEARARIKKFMSMKPVAVVATRGQNYSDDFMEFAKEYSVPLLKTKDATSSCMSAIISYLNI